MSTQHTPGPRCDGDGCTGCAGCNAPSYTPAEVARWRVVPADGTPFRFHAVRQNASIAEYLRSHWERDDKGRSLFRTEADAFAAIAKATGSAA